MLEELEFQRDNILLMMELQQDPCADPELWTRLLAELSQVYTAMIDVRMNQNRLIRQALPGWIEYA
jgi:hypothetical protein